MCFTYNLFCFVLFLFFFLDQDEFIVVDGKAKTKGKERRVFLFEKMVIFSEPMTREGGLTEFRYVHNMKVKVKLISYLNANTSRLFTKISSESRKSVRNRSWTLKACSH